VTASTFYGAHAGANTGAFSNIFAANALTTTNLFANTMTLANASASITGNLYVSNAVTTTNLFTAGITSNASNTIFNYDTLVVPFMTATTLNVTSTANILTQTIQGSTGLTSLNATGNIFISNALTTTNIFTRNVTATGIQTISGLAGLTSLNVTGNVVASNAITAANAFLSNVNFTSTTLGTAVAGQLQYNTYLYGTINTTSGRGSVPTDYIYRLTGTVLSSAITILNFFTGTAAGTGSLINLEASSVYNIEALCYFTKTNAGTIIWALNASSAPSHVSASYTASPITGIAASPGTTQAAAVVAYVWSQGQTSTAFAVTGSLTTGVNHSFLFKIQVVTNAATNFGIFATQSALSLTALAGSYYRVTKISTTTGTFA
jgi:hypothetical protein